MFCRQHDCKWIGCLLWLFTVLLGVLLLVVQIPLLILLTIDGELSIPRSWVEKAINHHLGEDYSITFDSISVDETGTVRIREATVRNKIGRKMGSAEFLKADFYLPSIVFGIFHVEQIQARNVEFIDTRGPLGIDSSVLEIPALNILRENDHWQIDDAKLICSNLPISISGNVRKPRLDQKTGPSTNHWIQFLEGISVLDSQMQRVKNPYLRIELSSTRGNANTVKATFTADRADLPFDIRLDDGVRISSGATLAGGDLRPGPIEFSAGHVSYSNSVSAERVRLRMPPPGGYSTTAMIAGAIAQVSAESLTTPEVTLSQPTLDLTVQPNFVAKAKGQVGLFGYPISIQSEINLLRRSATVETAGLLSVPDILSHPAVPREIVDFNIQFEKPVYARLISTFSKGKFIPDEVQFQAESEAFDISDLTGIYAQSAGVLYPHELRVAVNHILIQKTDYHLYGKYFHDFRSNKFRFLVQGGFMPMDIAGFMRSWWDDVWKEFVINDTPYVDLELWGDWDHYDLRSMFAGVRFSDIVLKGMEIDHGYARMRTRPHLFETFELYAFRPEGLAHGSFGILLDWETREIYANTYNLSTSVDFTKLAPLFGDELQEPLSTFELTTHPELRIEGILFPPIEGKISPANHLVINAATDDSLVYKGIELDDLQLTAVYQGKTLYLSPISFGLGGGKGSAHFTLWPDETDRGHSSFQLTLNDAIPYKVVQAIPQLKEAAGDRFDENQSDDLEDNSLNFSIEGSGNISEPETLLGEGNIDLLTPNLANVRLLGILSRISEELPLPITLGSFQFERVKTSFLLNRGLIEIPDLTLHSPSSRLLASGAYEMENQSIDFNAQMQLMREVKFPILAQIGMLLNPVGKVFEFHVWGEIDDLNWRLYLDPRSW